MSSIPVFDISNPLGGLLDQAVSMGYVNEKRTATKDSIITFDDNIEHAVSVKADIDPTLDGGSAVNIVSCGKNLFDPETVFTATGLYMYAKSIFPKNINLICKLVDKDPTVDISGIYFGFYDDTYTSGQASTGHFRWLVNNGTVQTNKTNKASGDATVLCNSLFAFPKDENTLDILLDRFYIQIEIGTTSTDYVEYDGNTSTISLGSTVYGGSVSISEEGEVELTTTYAAHSFTGSEEWTLDTDETYFETELDLGTAVFTDDSAYMTSNGILLRLQEDGKTIRAYLADNESLTAESDMNDVFTNTDKFVYELATSSSTDLTDIDPIETLVGENNIWANTGDIEVGYYYQLYQPI